MDKEITLRCACIFEKPDKGAANNGAEAINAGNTVRWKWQFQDFEKAFLPLQEVFESQDATVGRIAVESAVVIQQFEYVFEPAWLTLRSKMEFDGIKFDLSVPKHIFNLAYEKSYIKAVESWLNMTDDWYFVVSHINDFAKLARIYHNIKKLYYPALKNLYAYFKQELAGTDTLATDRNYFVHKSSYVDEGAEIGKGTKVWHFTHIMSGVKIGSNCSIGQNVNISGKVIIGNRVTIQDHVSLHGDIIIEDDVCCGSSCVFADVINPRAFIKHKHGNKQIWIKKSASIGANATIICGVTVGKYAVIGAGSVVTKDVPPYALVYGNPARVHGTVNAAGGKE